MEVLFSNNFLKSVRKLYWQESPIHKFYKLFKSDLPNFFRNIWLFKKALWNFQWWDYRFSLEMLETSIKIMAPRFEKDGIEVDISRLKKVEKMNRASEIIRYFIEDNFIELAEAQLGKVKIHPWEFERCKENPAIFKLVEKETEEEKNHNRKVFDRAGEIEEDLWNELWEIVRGTDRSTWKKFATKIPKKENLTSENFHVDIYDGTDMRSWWD